jgi:hypothetical protein
VLIGKAAVQVEALGHLLRLDAPVVCVNEIVIAQQGIEHKLTPLRSLGLYFTPTCLRSPGFYIEPVSVCAPVRFQQLLVLAGVFPLRDGARLPSSALALAHGPKAFELIAPEEQHRQGDPKQESHG